MVRWSAGYLAEKGVEPPQARLDAEHLLAHAVGTTRLQLYLQFDRPLGPEELGRYKPLLLRRGRREPLQYVLGRGAFRELDLRVDRRVLIPRPETEQLVEAVLEWARARAGVQMSPRRRPPRGVLPWSADRIRDTADSTASSPTEAPSASVDGEAGSAEGARGGEIGAKGEALTALDVGTGSGCIALSLALEGPFGRVVATDASGGALELARENAVEAGVEGRVEFRQGSLFGPVAGERFDVIVSNPPYVAQAEAGELQPEVRDHEPAEALFAGRSGLEVLELLVDSAPEHLRERGLLALEVGLGQARTVVERLRATRSFPDPRIRMDLAGRPRIVLAELDH
jgi:release factor glutamine methyltransferase